MTIRFSKYGPFFGCANFPECKATENISTNIVRNLVDEMALSCPDENCDGYLKYCRSKGGHFLGCSNYPTCRKIVVFFEYEFKRSGFIMATMTAQFLIGSGHPYDGGINPTHYLYLSENDRPALILVPQNIFEDAKNKTKESIVWIPTIENMLEDALLMIAIHVIKDNEVLGLAREYIKNFNKDRLELYESISGEDRETLYQANRASKVNYKIGLSVFKGSTLLNQLDVLQDYQMEVEVLLPAFSRYYSAWHEEMVVKGSLKYERK